MERIAIFAALQWECQPVLRSLGQVRRERVAGFTTWHGRSPRAEVWVVKTGMGMQHAGAAVGAICASTDCGLLVSTGCAGALSPELAPGDLAVATRINGHTSERFETDAAARERVQRAVEGAALRSLAGPVLCSPYVLATGAAKRAAAADGSVAGEREGAAIAACAGERGIPFISVRAILDTADTELPHAGRFIEPRSGTVRPLALAGYLVTHPGAVPQLLAMQRMMQAVQTSLDKFFGVWLAAE